MRVLKTLSASFFIACALNYCAAFNMVGWNFLVPGQYTFGLACTFLLVVICVAGLLWIAGATPVDTVVAGGGLALALVAVTSLITTGAIELKDYFIWGFVVTVPVAVFVVVMLVHLRHTVDTIRVSRALVRATPLWAVTLSVYVVGVLLDIMPDLQRFHRQQIYLLGVAAIASAVLLQVSKMLSRKVGPEKGW